MVSFASPSLISVYHLTTLSRFLISIHQATIVFLHADFAPEYIAYIYSKTPPPKLPHLIIHRSRDFDLEVPEHRKLAAETIIALAKLFMKQDNTD